LIPQEVIKRGEILRDCQEESKPERDEVVRHIPPSIGGVTPIVGALVRVCNDTSNYKKGYVVVEDEDRN